jgi:hypothetical protein
METPLLLQVNPPFQQRVAHNSYLRLLFKLNTVRAFDEERFHRSG